MVALGRFTASGGTKGDIVCFDYLVEDLKYIIKSQRSRFPGVPFFLLGTLSFTYHNTSPNGLTQ